MAFFPVQFPMEISTKNLTLSDFLQDMFFLPSFVCYQRYRDFLIPSINMVEVQYTDIIITTQLTVQACFSLLNELLYFLLSSPHIFLEEGRIFQVVLPIVLTPLSLCHLFKLAP
jgi:hypothetical protein